MAQAKSLSEIELRRVLGDITQHKHAARNRVMVLLTFYAGLRVGEVASLKWADVFEVDGKIKDQLRLKPEQTKGSEARVVMLSEKIQRELIEYAKTVSEKLKQPNNKPFIYSQQNRNGFNSNTLSQTFKVIFNRANIDGATSHSGRRTFITRLANKGIGVRVLMALAGHKNLATTQLYIDVNDEMLKLAVNLM